MKLQSERAYCTAIEIRRPNPGDGVLATLVMPMNTEGLTSLQNIIDQDTSGIDELSKQRLQRRAQRLAGTARISFVKQGLP
jgi:hypothetical protein